MSYNSKCGAMIVNRNFTTVTKFYDFENNFDNYKVVENGITFHVPLDEANTDYQAIQEWIADGNTVIDNKPE